MRTAVKLIAVAIIIVAVVSVAAIAIMPSNTETQGESTIEQKIANILNKLPTERPQYFKPEVQQIVFQNLPKMPDDFYQVRTMILYNLVDFDPQKVNRSYWEQPEWFPTYADRTIPIIQNATAGRTAIWCLGIYPSKNIVILNKVGNDTEGYSEFDRYVWVRPAPLVEQTIGVKANVAYPEAASVEASEEYGTPGVSVIQDPSVTAQYITMDIDADEFLLTPSFPIYTYDYVRMIDMHVKVRNDIPPGKYVIGVDFGAPSKEFTNENMWKYKLYYTDPNVGMACSARQALLFIEVNS